MEFLSTRLFPKNKGAEAYILTGIAAKCDWVVLSDNKAPYTFLKKNIKDGSPNTVFLSLRNLRAVLPFFVEQVLPNITASFVLISGSEDVTLPNQVDKRWAPLSESERSLFFSILDCKYLIHWYVENLDEPVSERITPIPVGMVYPDSLPGTVSLIDIATLSERPLTVLCAHRIRDGAQWQARKDITRIASTNWKRFTTVVTDEVSEDEFIELVKQHSFIICAQGGGLDPSPKAWQALYYGAIPIVKSSALDGAYRQLPVVHVDNWNSDALTVEKLYEWRECHSYHFDTREGREALLEKLTLDYWWKQILRAANIEEPGKICPNF